MALKPSCGTIISNRLEKYPISNPKQLKKPRGFYGYYTDGLDKIAAVGWNENKCVLVAFNTFSSSPTTSVARCFNAQWKRVKVASQT